MVSKCRSEVLVSMMGFVVSGIVLFEEQLSVCDSVCGVYGLRAAEGVV